MSKKRIVGHREAGHRRRWTPETHWLPGWCKARLDADGKVRGVTWRQMPPQDRNHAREDIQAMNWWLWKRGLLLRRHLIENNTQRAQRDALQAMADEEAAEAS